MIYLTGDTHGRFYRLELFCEKYKTTKDDLLIILGDAGFNIYGQDIDRIKKEYVHNLPITVFCIHGNHEMRPQNLNYYDEKQNWHGGNVYVEQEFPDIIFAKDGEVYDFVSKERKKLKTMVIGGAYSVDKEIRLSRNWPWWADEQPDEKIKQRVESKLQENDWKVDMVLTHTVPEKFLPTDMFLPSVDQEKVDRSTEIWLDTIESRLQYDNWFAGHYHCERKTGKLQILYQNYISL